MSYRPQRLASEIHKLAAVHLQEHLQRSDVTVTEVDVSADLRNATVWVSVLDVEDEEAVARVQEEVGRLRTRVARQIAMRRAPRITIKQDDRGQRADELQQQMPT